MTPNDPFSPFRHALPTALLLASACTGAEVMPAGPDLDSDAGAQCLSNRDFFAQEVWPAVFGKTCITCHAPGGVAVEDDAAFHLLPASYPGFIDANLKAVEEISRNEYDGTSLLLAKPSGLVKHGGGTVLKKDSAEYALLLQLLTRLREGDPCSAAAPTEDFAGVTLLSPRETFRKASLQLAARLPNGEENAKLKGATDEAMAPMLDALMKEPAFYVRLKEMFNDILLSDRYYRNEDAVNLLSSDTYPRAETWFDEQTEDNRRAINRALAREPLELIAHIVRSGKPFSELLTANYTVVNPFSAQLYDLQLDFDDSSDESEWKEARIRVSYEGGRANIPHAGILTNPMWLNRFPTSETNRNRHRARMVMEQFLATDILKVAERPIDPLASTKYNNPTRDDPSCASCHRQLDPIAGAFMKWDDNDQEELDPTREWYRDSFAPGFGDELIPVEDFDSAQRWLAKRIVNDPRFGLAMVRHVYSALTGHKPLEYPAQGAAEQPALLAAWEAQERVFRSLTEAFKAADYDLRAVIHGIIMSPYYRATNVEEEGAADALALADVGTGRLTIPEVLDRKIAATVGFHWQRDWDRAAYLRGDYAILYGGIDSDVVTTRLTDLNGVMSGVQWRLANELACKATAWELSRPASKRLLLKYVELDTTPTAEDGTDDAAGILSIKKNIQYLEQRFWGTTPALDDPEVLAAYALFLETFREGIQGVASDAIPEWLPWSCQARQDPTNGKDLPEPQRLEQDPRYTVRAWMAVLTYLMSDYQFLYE